MDMEPKNGNGAGDGSTPRKKRAPSARKRAPKAVKSAEQDTAAATVREEAPRAEATPAKTEAAEANRSDGGTRPSGQQRASGERLVDLRGSDESTFGERDAESPADLAADLKSWMDTRREDRDTRGEVL
jgi:hypothetical protein